MVDGLWTRDYQTSLSKILVYSWWLLVHFFLMEYSLSNWWRCFLCLINAMVESFILYGDLTTGWLLIFTTCKLRHRSISQTHVMGIWRMLAFYWMIMDDCIFLGEDTMVASNIGEIQQKIVSILDGQWFFQEIGWNSLMSLDSLMLDETSRFECRDLDGPNQEFYVSNRPIHLFLVTSARMKQLRMTKVAQEILYVKKMSHLIQMSKI